MGLDVYKQKFIFCIYFVCVCVRTCHMHIIHIIMQFGLWD